MLWDEDSFAGCPLQVVLLGSSQFLMRQGLTESLAGRFELIRVPHWSFAEMRDAFGWDVERYVYFGGYPGAAPLAEDEFRWKSLEELCVGRDHR
ncbi:MAG: putative ATPase, partial [Proteobacteria bacterium]|nr:putative ATPase [Pseudomonadota bacterium]